MRSPEASLLEVESLEAGYDDAVILRGVSLGAGADEIVAIIGPNGAGKSTTLKMLSGVLEPTSGTAEVLGLVPWRERRADSLQRARDPVERRCLAIAFGAQSCAHAEPARELGVENDSGFTRGAFGGLFCRSATAPSLPASMPFNDPPVIPNSAIRPSISGPPTR